MAEDNEHNITDELLFRHFAGELPVDLEKQINDWRAMSQENEQKYNETHVFYLDVKAVSSLKQQQQSYDVDIAWRQVKVPKADKGVRLFIPNQVLRIAASIVFVVGLGWFGYQEFFTAEQMTMMATAEILEEELADGSIVSLNNGAELSYPDKFLGDTREVELKGQAYFEVEPNPNKPFVVKVQEMEIRVLGTAFYVDAVAEGDTMNVIVDEGLVKVITANSTKKLEAGTSVIYVRSTQTLSKIEVGSTSTHNYWRTKVLNYSGSTLNDVIASLEEVYDVSILLDNPDLKNCRITVVFEDEAIENILNVIAATLNLELKIDGGTYQLSGESCDP